MITLIRSATIHDGKLEEAFGWAVKVAGYLNGKFDSVNLQVARNVGGALYQVHWIATGPSLAECWETTQKTEADSGYKDLLAEGRQQGFLIGSSVTDQLLQSIP